MRKCLFAALVTLLLAGAVYAQDEDVDAWTAAVPPAPWAP